MLQLLTKKYFLFPQTWPPKISRDPSYVYCPDTPARPGYNRRQLVRQTCTETLSLIRQISADSGIEADCSVSLFNSPAILTSYGESESWVHLETTTEPLVRQPVRTAVKTTSSAWRCLMAGHSHQTIRDIMRHSRIQVGADMVELLTNKNCVCFRTHWLQSADPTRLTFRCWGRRRRRRTSSSCSSTSQLLWTTSAF